MQKWNRRATGPMRWCLTEMRAVRIAGGLILLVIVACFMASVSGEPMTPGNYSLLRWGPVLTNMTTESVTISWATEDPVTGTVSYSGMSGSTQDSSPNRVTEGQASVIHRITLDNLAPDQTYAYSVSGSPKEYSFRTFPEQGPIRFVVYGDTREQLPGWNQSTHHALVAGRIATEPDIRFVVHTGDMVNDPADRGEWDRFFAAAGPIMAHVPFYAMAGNHEGNTGVTQKLFGTPPWYVISCGDVRVVVLDSNPLPAVQAAEQDRFIAGNPGGSGNWTFVALHHPPYSADPNHPGGFRNVRERWEPVFRDWDVSAVYSGHVHAYEHLERSGIHYFTVATGGAPSYQLSPERPEGYVASRENTLGYAVVSIARSGLCTIQYIEVARIEDGKVIQHTEAEVIETVVVEHPHGDSSAIVWWPLPDSLADVRTILLHEAHASG